MNLSYQIRRSSRAKLARIVVSRDKVEVVAPVNMPDEKIAQFIAVKQAWVMAALKKIHLKAPSIQTLAPVEYHHGALVPYQGKQYPLNLSFTQLKGFKVEFNDAFFMQIPQTIKAAEQQAYIQLALSAWMKKTIKTKIMRIVEYHGPKFRLYPTIIRVKTQKSRWGSCSHTNAININWLLLLAPSVILEYVVVHELCHIREKNHSAAFWQLVAAHLPDYQQHRLWLKQHGASLMGGLACSSPSFCANP